MADDTIRKQILAAWVDYFEADEWITAGGISVNPGKTRYKKNEMPGISVFAGEEESGRDKYGKQDCKVQVEFKYVGLLAVGADVFQITEDIRGQLINTAMNAEDDFSNDREYAGGTIDYPASDDEAYQVSIMMNIHYQTLIGNPYEQGD